MYSHSYYRVFYRGLGEISIKSRLNWKLSRYVSRLQHNKIFSRAAFNLRYIYNEIIHPVPRFIFYYSSLSVAGLTLALTLYVHTQVNNLVATATTFYATYLFTSGIFSGVSIPVIYRRKSQFHADGDEPGSFWVGFNVMNRGDRTLQDLKTRYRLYDADGRPISAWRPPIEQYEIDHSDPDEIVTVNPEERTETISIPFSSTQGFVKKRPKDDATVDALYSNVPEIRDHRPEIFVEIRASGRLDYPFLFDSHIEQVDIEIEESDNPYTGD